MGKTSRFVFPAMPKPSLAPSSAKAKLTQNGLHDYLVYNCLLVTPTHSRANANDCV